MAICVTQRATEMEEVVTFVHVKPIKSRKKCLYAREGGGGGGSYFGIPANQ